MKKKKVLFPHTTAMVGIIERWLNKMSNQGWALIKMKGWMFYFINAKPCERRYFIYYSLDSTKGASIDYFNAKSLYKKANRDINNQSSQVFEADTRKIDKRYFDYIRLRDKYYLKWHFQRAICTFIVFLGMVSITHRSFFAILEILMLIMLINSILSMLLIVILSRKTNSDNNITL